MLLCFKFSKEFVDSSLLSIQRRTFEGFIKLISLFSDGDTSLLTKSHFSIDYIDDLENINSVLLTKVGFGIYKCVYERVYFNQSCFLSEGIYFIYTNINVHYEGVKLLSE